MYNEWLTQKWPEILNIRSQFLHKNQLCFRMILSNQKWQKILNFRSSLFRKIGDVWGWFLKKMFFNNNNKMNFQKIRKKYAEHFQKKCSNTLSKKVIFPPYSSVIWKRKLYLIFSPTVLFRMILLIYVFYNTYHPPPVAQNTKWFIYFDPPPMGQQKFTGPSLFVLNKMVELLHSRISFLNKIVSARICN
jgi:hypothetical protein